MTKYFNEHFDKKILMKFNKIIIPAFLTSLIYGSYGIVDSIFAGQYVKHGEKALASMGYNVVFLLMSVAFSMLGGVGLSVSMNKYLSKNNKSEASRIVNSFIPLAFLFWIPILILSQTLAKYFVFLGSGFTWPDSTVLEYSVTYIRIFGLLSILFIIGGFTDMLILNQNKAHLSLLFSTTGFVSNFLLNWLFVVVLDMGIMGLALGTGLAQIPVVIMQVWYLYFKAPFKSTSATFKNMWQTIKEVFSNGSSASIGVIMNAMILLTFTFFIGVFSSSQEEQTILTGAFLIVFSVYSLLSHPSFGVTLTSQQLFVNGYHQKKIKEVKTIFAAQLTLIMIFSLITILITTVATNEVLLMFLNQNDPNIDDITNSAKKMVPIFFATYWLMALAQAIPPFLVGIDAPKEGTRLSILTIVATPITIGIAGLIFSNTWELVYGVIFLNIIIYTAGVAVLSYTLKTRGGWVNDPIPYKKKNKKLTNKINIPKIKNKS